MPKTKYTKELLAPLVKQSVSYSDLLRKLGLQVTGGNQCNIKQRIMEYDLSIEHFVATTTGQQSWNRKSPKEILVDDPSAIVRKDRRRIHRALLEIGRPYECEGCGNTGTWRGKKLVLEIDHINGDWKNNLSSNLRFLCLNCHSQTPTYYNRS